MGVLATGSLLALNDAVTADSLDSNGSVGVVLSGSWVGTVSFQGSLDGSNFSNIFALGLDGTFKVNTSVNGSFILNPAGLRSIRVISTAYTSGATVATIQLGGASALINSLSTVVGNTDGTRIGNYSDRLKTSVNDISNLVSTPIHTSVGVTAIRIDSPALSNRKEVDIVAQKDLYLGFTNAVTTSSGWFMKLYKGQVIGLALGPSVQLWAISSTSGGTSDVVLSQGAES